VSLLQNLSEVLDCLLCVVPHCSNLALILLMDVNLSGGPFELR
jgi:hypothetical protein